MRQKCAGNRQQDERRRACGKARAVAGRE